MIIIIVISFMQGIYKYIPETNHVPREYSVPAILSLLFMVSISLVPALALLYFYVSTSEVCAQCPIWLFSVVPSLYGFLVCCLCVYWMILKWSQLLLLLLVSPLFLPSTCVVQGGSNMTGTDLCVNKSHCAAAVRPWESEATTSTLPPARVRTCSVLSGSC